MDSASDSRSPTSQRGLSISVDTYLRHFFEIQLMFSHLVKLKLKRGVACSGSFPPFMSPNDAFRLLDPAMDHLALETFDSKFSVFFKDAEIRLLDHCLMTGFADSSHVLAWSVRGTSRSFVSFLKLSYDIRMARLTVKYEIDFVPG